MEFVTEHEPSLRSQKKDSWETPNGITLSVKSKRETVKLLVRLLLEGMDLDVEVPLDLTALELKNSLIDELHLPKHDSQAIPYEWKMIALTSKLVIRDELTLRECNIRDGEVIIFTTGLMAGAPVDSL